MSRCHACGTGNAPGMNFCQNCGAKLPDQAPPSAPDYSRPGYGAPPPPQQPAYGAPVPASPAHGNGQYGSGPRPMPSPSDVVRQGGAAHPAVAPTRTCPSCGAQTPDGFAFCQQCGSKIPTGPADAPRGPAAVSGETSGGAFDEAHAATLAAPGSAEVASLVARGGQGAAAGAAHGAARAQEAPAWGRLVSVERDGTDGGTHPLAGDWVVVGRVDADVSFPDDRFMARGHARLEQGGGTPRVVPLDALNGVFRRVDDPVALDDGAVMLLGREVLRFERVVAEERDAPPLVRHGTALFGSPPREPWGRLVQLLPSGGVRDIRYLDGDEITVGREEGDLVFRDDAFLSRIHAVLRREGDRVMLDDLDSSNGSFLRLRGPEPLSPGTHLRMGDQLFRFEPA